MPFLDLIIPPQSLRTHGDSDMALDNGNIKCRSESSALSATLVVIDPKQNDTVQSESRRLCSLNRSFAARPAKPKVDDNKVKGRKETRKFIDEWEATSCYLERLELVTPCHHRL